MLEYIPQSKDHNKTPSGWKAIYRKISEATRDNRKTLKRTMKANC